MTFTVPGRPQPKGSTKGFPIKRANGKIGVVITSSNKELKPWALTASYLAKEAMEGDPPLDGPLNVEVECFFKRPKSVSRKVLHKVTRPDVDKVARAALDTLTGVVFNDDSQVVMLVARKWFGEHDETRISVFIADEGDGLWLTRKS